MKRIGKILIALAFALAMPLRQMNVWLQLLAASLVVLAVLMPTKGISGVSTAGINREAWESHIEENLFPDNEFLLGMTDLSEYVNFLTVHDPQAGAVPNFTMNRAKGGAPVNVNQRTDTTNDWNINEWTSDPFLITNAEEVQLSYDKMSSILFEMEQEARRQLAENILVSISPTGTATLPANMGGGTNNNILRTSGYQNNDTSTTVSWPAYTPGAINNRLAFTLWDVRQAHKYLNKTNIPKADRHMVMSPDAADQIIQDLIVTKYRQDAQNVFDVKNGSLDMLMGFKIHIRSQVCQYNNAGTPVVKAFGSAGAATDNDAIIFFQKNFVGRATGDIHVYEKLNDPTYYGDVYSVLIRMGANKRRTSELGVGAIVQAASA